MRFAFSWENVGKSLSRAGFVHAYCVHIVTMKYPHPYIGQDTIKPNASKLQKAMKPTMLTKKIDSSTQCQSADSYTRTIEENGGTTQFAFGSAKYDGEYSIEINEGHHSNSQLD